MTKLQAARYELIQSLLAQGFDLAAALRIMEGLEANLRRS